MAVTIASDLVARLLGVATASPDAEICGLLFGDDTRIAEARTAANVAADPARAFELDPAALFAALREERSGGPRVIGHYHSHPHGLPEPSPRDAAAANEGLWLILGGGEARLWRAVAGGSVLDAFEAVALRPAE